MTPSASQQFGQVVDAMLRNDTEALESVRIDQEWDAEDAQLSVEDRQTLTEGVAQAFGQIARERRHHDD